MKNFFSILLTPLFLFATSTLPAQELPKPPKLFEEPHRINATLKGPWRTISRRPSDERKYPGELSYTADDGSVHSFPIEISTRGLTRRDKVCTFPPLKLWFDKETTRGTIFRGQSSLKMVTHCKTSKAYAQFYVTEFLSYRIYNLITDYSFRVRPMMVNYVEGERDSKPLERFGFLIEDVDDVAERLDLVELEIPESPSSSLDPVETSNYALFQYMISNLDWSATGGPDPVECCHNSKLIGQGPDQVPVFAIPYDLDSSGLVDAPYAAPPEILKVRSLKQRLYRGWCFHNEYLPAALERYVDNKQAIFDLFLEHDLLTNNGKRNAVNFLEGFYEKLETPDGIDEWLVDRCRGR